MPSITIKKINENEPKDKDYFLWDEGKGAVSGFGLKITKGGKKVFVYQYRNSYGQTRRLTIGKYGSLSPEEARKVASKHSAAVASGKDPAKIKQEAREAKTVGHLLDLYLESETFRQKGELTKRYDRARVERHLKPLIGRKIARELTKEDVRGCFNDIEKGKTASDTKLGLRSRSIVKGGPSAARSCIRLLRAAFSWAVEQGDLESNVAKGVKIGKDKERKTVLSEVSQYESLFLTLEKMESEHRINPKAADIIRVIALTGARKTEIAGCLWKYVDLKKNLIILPPESHKAGAETNKNREIGLPSEASAIIANQPKGSPECLVFPSSTGGVISLTKVWQKVRTEAALPEGIGLHGLRHSYATMMALQGAEAAQIMASLGHSKLETSQGYIHLAQNIKAQLAEKHAAPISGALKRKRRAEIVPLNTKNNAEK